MHPALRAAVLDHSFFFFLYRRARPGAGLLWLCTGEGQGRRRHRREPGWWCTCKDKRALRIHAQSVIRSCVTHGSTVTPRDAPKRPGGGSVGNDGTAGAYEAGAPVAPPTGKPGGGIVGKGTPGSMRIGGPAGAGGRFGTLLGSAKKRLGGALAELAFLNLAANSRSAQP